MSFFTGPVLTKPIVLLPCGTVTQLCLATDWLQLNEPTELQFQNLKIEHCLKDVDDARSMNGAVIRFSNQVFLCLDQKE